MKCLYKIFLLTFFLAALASAPAAIRVFAVAPTYGPDLVTLNVINSSEIDLSWTSITADPAITGYKIERESPVGGGFTVIVANTGSTARTYANTGLAPNVVYNYRISAINSDGTGPASANQASASTYPAPTIVSLPDVPQNPSAAAVSGTSTILSWVAPSQGDAPTGYKIERNGATIVANTGSTARTYTDSGLVPGVTYDYRIYAIDSAGVGNPTPHFFATMPTVPLSPAGAKAVAGDGQATVSWLAAYAASGGISNYVVTSSASSSLTVSSNTLTAVVSGLTNGVSYIFSVSAVNLAGASQAAMTNAVVPMVAATSSLSVSQSSSITVVTAKTPVATKSAFSDVNSLQEQIKNLTVLLQQLMSQVQEKQQASSSGQTGTNVQSSGASASTSLSGYYRDLTIGFSGADVVSLQNFLIKEDIGPRSRELEAVGSSDYFGKLTQAALAEYQASAGIEPAAGYFGPKTRSYISALNNR